jgi:DNA-binding SARP family transcriptional activator/tetratricopeptide (TPR) repeat protein
MPGGHMKAVDATMRFAVLGPLRAWHGDDEVDLGTPQQRALLAVLLVQTGNPVVMSEIIDVLWPHGAPPTAVNVIQRYVSRLRHLVPGGRLQRLAGGYRLDLGAAALDLLTFRQLLAEGRSMSGHDPHQALDRIVAALDHWKGPVAAGIDEAVRNAPMFAAVDNERTTAVLQASDLALPISAGNRILPALRTVAATTPLDEVVQAALIRMLAATGRQAEALAHFTAVRERLAEDLGVDPGPDLTAAHTEALRNEPAPAPRAAAAVPAAPVIRPAQLPADLRTFAGRSTSLQRLEAFLSRSPSKAVAIAAISGMGGVGKTTLAVHSAHKLAPAYPDGQLYANMRGFDPAVEPVAAQEALRGFLGALGITDSSMPKTLAEQVTLYRSVLAGRRVLVVLDNVRDAEHARPLLPGMPGSAAIVTSRDPLTGLVIREDALMVALNPLSPEEGRALLSRRLGRERTTQAYEEVTRVLDACGGLPLALALFAARASSYPDQALERLADEVDDSRRRLDGFSRADAEHDLRAVFSWSYELLDVDTARLFRLLALHPGQSFGVAAAASLLGARTGSTDVLLRELCRAGLLTEYQPGRFRHHDLVRAYSTELLHEQEPAPHQDAAGRRLLDHYAHSVVDAAVRLDPRRLPPTACEATDAGVSVERFADSDQALEWLTLERPALLTMVDRAAAVGADRLVCGMAWGLEPFLRRREFWSDWESTQLNSLYAARRLGDPVAEARAHYALGFLYCPQNLDQNEASENHLREAVRLCIANREHELHARVLLVVADQHRLQGRLDDERAVMSKVIDLYRTLEDEAPDRVEPDLVAYVHRSLGDLDNALAYALRAIESLHNAGNYAEATAWHTLACIHADREDWEAALAASDRAGKLYRALGDEYMEAFSQADLGGLLITAGQIAAAGRVLGPAIAILERLDSPKAVDARRLLDSVHAVR